MALMLTGRGTVTYLVVTCALAASAWAQATAPPQAPTAGQTGSGTADAATTEDTVVVRMIDPVDSSRDAQGKQYRAIVTKDASAGLMAIPKGSPAKIVLVKTASGWSTQLIAVNIYGTEAEVTSRSATVMGLVPGAAGGVVGVATGLLGGFGRKKPATPANPTVSGDQVNLIPGTEVQFTLGPPQAAIPTTRTPASRPVPAVPGETKTRSGAADVPPGTAGRATR
jgi:hypothetical protein